ncbi:Sorting nexin-29 [Eumeta japonica]|uniref:Sorting nexin-29 n=1 Tax=Eumeta variegata TaxID=151549 RepID=A0A4C1T9M0_EUMVA|nr:Sorting nexin-29 [Eumeta japonica]
MEYYEEGSLVRETEASHLLPNMAAGMSAILFALSIDRTELNDTQQPTNLTKSEHVIPLPVPVKTTTNLKRKPLRQIITFDKNEETKASEKDRRKSYQPTTGTSDSSCKSAPPTCLNSPDPNNALQNATSSISEPTSTDFKSIKQFFPDSVKGIDSPSQILSRLSERAKEIFSSSHSIDVHNACKDDVSDVSISNLKISESDSEEVAGSIDGSTSCLELCFTEDESGHDDNSIQSVLAKKDQDYMALQLKCSQIEITGKDKIKKLEKLVLDLSKENDRLKEQLKKYMSAVGIHTALRSGESENEEVHQYERKLVQVAEMHAELMEFNQQLQRRLLEVENTSDIETECSISNVKVHIPAAFLVGKKSHSYHVYQIFIKIGQEEWNVYHRYAKFHELHMQLKKCHNDIASFKFPPKKTLGKKDARVVERRRIELQSYLRHVVLVLPELRNCTSRANLVTLLPFFGSSSSNFENGMTGQALGSRQTSVQESIPTYAAL